mgnify:CR=1 FL=1
MTGDERILKISLINALAFECFSDNEIGIREILERFSRAETEAERCIFAAYFFNAYGIGEERLRFYLSRPHFYDNDANVFSDIRGLAHEFWEAAKRFETESAFRRKVRAFSVTL